MAPKFVPGATVYAKDGRSYVVEAAEDGIVYCTSQGGGETEFPEAALQTAAEWNARADNRRDLFYTRLKQAKPYVTLIGKQDRAGSERALAKIERLSPGILDFVAYTVAARVMADGDDPDGTDRLSIPKCRDVFDAARPEIAIGLVANLFEMQTSALVGAGNLGDNLMRALIDKGLAAHADAFEDFLDRPRR